MTGNFIKNIGNNWKEIGGNGREKERRDQKGLTKKKRKKKLKKEEQKNGMKKMRWKKQRIYMTSCKKFLGQKFLRGKYCHELPQP